MQSTSLIPHIAKYLSVCNRSMKDLPVSPNVTSNICKCIYAYCDIDESISISLLEFDEPSQIDASIKKWGSLIFTKFLHTSRTGSAHTYSGISIQTFFSSMLASSLYFIFQFLLFIILRGRLKNIYQAKRIYQAASLEARSCQGKNTSARGIRRFCASNFNWMRIVIKAPVDTYRDELGLDGYLFLRYLKKLTLFFLTLSSMHLPILIPIHYLSSHIDASDDNPRGLDRISISSVIQTKSKMLVLHLILSIFVLILFHFMLISEIKHVYDISKSIRKGNADITIFIDKIPQNLQGCSAKLIQSFNHLLPETNIEARYLPKNCQDIRKRYSELKTLEQKMEKIVFQITLNRYFSESRMPKEPSHSRRWRISDHAFFVINMWKFHLCTIHRYFYFPVELAWQETETFPKNYLPSISFKSTSFTEERRRYLDVKFKQYNALLKNWKRQCIMMNKWDNAEYYMTEGNSRAPVHFDKMFVRIQSANRKYSMAEILLRGSVNYLSNIMVVPDMKDIVWRNIKISNPAIKFIRVALANILSIFITVGYIIPVALVALISQVPYLASITPFLSHINTGSKLIDDTLAGIVPIITLVFLTEVVPYIFRYFSYLRCKRTGAEIEIDSQKWFFVFLFIHVFLVVTISSGISFLMQRLVDNPASIPEILAHDLPKSSNFFCSFIAIRSLAYSGGNFLQLKELLLEVFYYRLGIYSPQSRLKRMKDIPVFQWGSIYPIFSVLGCIGIIYSIISPLILPLCVVGFSLVYFSFKYVFEFQYEGKGIAETYGKLYLQALMQLYAGIYFMEFCMIGLFALSNQYKLCLCMSIILCLTFVAHLKVSQFYGDRLNLSTFLSIDKPIERSKQSTGQDIDIPFADGRLQTKIYLPKDHSGIADEERQFLMQNYNIECDMNQFALNRRGDITCTNL